jgi:hypothetical protein
MRHHRILGYCSTLAALVSDDHCFALLVSRVRKRRARRLDGDILSLTVSSSSSFTDDTEDNDDVSAKTIGQRKRRLEKSTRREDRIHQLETSSSSLSTNGVPWKRSKAEDAELTGLLRLRNKDDDINCSFVEQYDSSSFDDEHVEFKRKHNEAFVALARYCHQQRNNENNREGFGVDDDDENDSESKTGNDPNVFYLDGPDASTSSVLIDIHDFDPRSCYIANRHKSTCDLLQRKIPFMNVMHASAAEALMVSKDINSFSNVNFAAYYFDGCGGFPPHIIDMMSAALVRPPGEKSHDRRGITAVGYSLMGGNRNAVDKELDICRALTLIATANGMRARHVLDDPERYGLPMDIVKTTGGTFTSWMILEDAGILI